MPEMEIRIGQVWTHRHDQTHYRVIGRSGDRVQPWKTVIVKEDPALVRKHVNDDKYSYILGEQHNTAIGPDTQAWVLVEDSMACPGCDRHNYVEENDYLCVVCRG